MAKHNIAVTGLNAADTPCPGISVIRSLKEASCKDDIRIVGLDYELLCSALYLDTIVDEVYNVGFPQDDEDAYLARVGEIIEKTRLDILIPTLDFEIPIMSKLESELRDLGIRLLVPPESALQLCKKENLLRLSQLADIDFPYSITFSDRRQITESAAQFSYPLMIKAANGEASVVYSLEEALVFSIRLLSLWGPPLIMQKYIKGDEYCVASLADRRQRLVGSVCMKKILKSRSGTAWMGVTTKDDTLIAVSRKIIERLKWVGPIEIEFIKEQNSHRYFLIEINARFPAWIELAAKAGCNLVEAYVKLALHQKLDSYQPYKSGVLFARSALDITCDISRLGQLATKRQLLYHQK
jgi:carbamoyl-phosphate synthase large subunit